MNKPLPYYIVALLGMFVALLFTTCAKEYSYEGGNTSSARSGSAVYTLSGAGGTCTGSVILGKYYAGSALDTTHSIQLQVNVTATGTYSLRTPSLNGIQFSISGTFTNTGIQTITLFGSGTPLVEGIFNFTTPGTGCSFKVTVKKLSDVLADFTLAGAPNSCTDALVNGRYVYGKPLTIDHTVVVKVNVTAIGTYKISTDTLDGISFSASGIFTITGDQTVTLAGSGTPAQSDNLVFTPTPSLGNPGCTFAVTVLNGEPVATYVLQSGSDSLATCEYTVAGTYKINTNLTASNSVRINVFVAVLGNYTIVTDPVNGMRFYHTGMFTITGPQGITLAGSGTPLLRGTTFFRPQIVGPHPLGGQACSFSIMVN